MMRYVTMLEQLEQAEETLLFTQAVLGAVSGACGRAEALLVAVGTGQIQPVDAPLRLEASRQKMRQELHELLEKHTDHADTLNAMIALTIG